MLHRWNTFIAVLLVSAAATAPAASAKTPPPKPLPARPVAAPELKDGILLGAADARTLAVRDANGDVTLLTDGGSRRTIPVIPGCLPDAVGSGRIAWDCDAVPATTPAPSPLVGPRPMPPEWPVVLHAVVVTDLAGAERGRVTIPAVSEAGQETLSRALAVGAVWVEHEVYSPGEKSGPDTLWTNWYTGEERSYAPGVFDRRDTGVHADLDRSDLVAPYCAGVAARPVKDWDGYSSPPLRPVLYRAPWAIVDTRDDVNHPTHHELHRCGHPNAVASAPAGLTTARAVTLGTGWVAWAPASAKQPVSVTRLTDRRSFATSVVSSALPVSGDDPLISGHAPATRSLVLTARSLWIGGGGGPVRRVALPRS